MSASDFDSVRPEDPAQKLPAVSAEPGVYLMRDAQGQIIYVGKARNLRKRLAAYFKPSGHADAKVGALAARIADFETIITRTEKEALILESNLIKRHRPRYNVVLKDDKRYPSLRLDPGEDFPRFTIARKIGEDDALYFGPFASAHAVRETLGIITKTFKLRKCKASEFRIRTRPCLHCQMNGCLAPCCRDVDPRVYQEQVQEAVLFLKGRTHELIRKIRVQMDDGLRGVRVRKGGAAARQALRPGAHGGETDRGHHRLPRPGRVRRRGLRRRGRDHVLQRARRVCHRHPPLSFPGDHGLRR